jgi:hypothetical protein
MLISGVDFSCVACVLIGTFSNFRIPVNKLVLDKLRVKRGEIVSFNFFIPQEGPCYGADMQYGKSS